MPVELGASFVTTKLQSPIVVSAPAFGYSTVGILAEADVEYDLKILRKFPSAESALRRVEAIVFVLIILSPHVFFLTHRCALFILNNTKICPPHILVSSKAFHTRPYFL